MGGVTSVQEDPVDIHPGNRSGVPGRTWKVIDAMEAFLGGWSIHYLVLRKQLLEEMTSFG